MFKSDKNIEENKAKLRAEMKSIRTSFCSDERQVIDQAIRKRVCALPQFRDADTVFAYLSFGTEIETRGIIERAWSAGKEVVLPRCTAPREMRWFRVASFDGLEKSRFGVDEPPINPELEVLPGECENALALVPGLTFDDAGYRLGYGGGFYDAFLEEFPGVSVGLCRSAQRTANLAERGVLDTCDKPVAIVVDET